MKRDQSRQILRKRRLLPFLALLATAAPVFAEASKTPASLVLGAGPDRFAEGVARTVASVLTYTRWPDRPNPVRLCVVGSARHAARLDDGELPGGVVIKRRDVAANARDLGADCDALYIGALASPAMQRLTADVRRKPVVTIAESDPDCRGGAMFCLLFAAKELSFEMNVDAISRSAVRIDPRVLRMSTGY